MGPEAAGSAEDIASLIRDDLSLLCERAGLKVPRFGETRLIQEGKRLPGNRSQQAALYEKLILRNIDNVEPERPREALFVKLNLRDGYPDSSSEKRLAELGRSRGLKISDEGRNKQTENYARSGIEELANLIRKEIDERTEQQTWDALLAEIAIEPISRPPEPSTSEADISIDSINITLVLDDDGRLIGRESIITLSALRSLEAPISAVYEFNDGKFKIDNTMNCAILDPHDFDALSKMELQEGLQEVDALKTLIAEMPDQEDEGLRHLKMRIQKIGEDMNRIHTKHGKLRQAHQEKLRQALEGIGTPDMMAIELSSLEAGKPLTFSYNTSYPRPVDKETVLSFILPEAPSRKYGLVYFDDPDKNALAVNITMPLPRVTLRIRANRPLKVVPHLQAPGTPQFLSMAVIPLIVVNRLERGSDGSYEHTFYDLPPDSVAMLMWFAV